MTIKICDYGCGKEAKYYFKYAKKWCCSSHTSRCPSVRKKNSVAHKIDTISSSFENPENILCEYGCGRVAKFKLRVNEKLCCSESPSSCSKLKHINYIRHRTTLEDLKEKYPFFCKIENLREVNNKIEVRCKWCDKWFVPGREQLRARINHLESEYGNGGSYLYCSEKCKSKCPSFNIKYTNDGSGDVIFTSSEYQTWKQEVLKKQKELLGYNECEFCGNIDVSILEVHHEKPISTHPHLALDLDNGIVLCGRISKNKCHQKLHKGKCSSVELNRKKCLVKGD